MNSNLKTGAFWIVLACVLVLGWQVVKSGRSRPEKTIIFTDFIREVEAGKVRKVTISDGTHVEGEYKDNGPSLHTLIPAHYVDIYKILQDHNVDIEIREESGKGWVSVLINAYAVYPAPGVLGLYDATNAEGYEKRSAKRGVSPRNVQGWRKPREVIESAREADCVYNSNVHVTGWELSTSVATRQDAFALLCQRREQPIVTISSRTGWTRRFRPASRCTAGSASRSVIRVRGERE